MRKKHKLISTIIALMTAFGIASYGCVACGSGVNGGDLPNVGGGNNTTVGDSSSNGDGNTLQVLKSDLKLTQEQKLSQIKAEYLKTNGGYDKNDDVVAIVTLPQAAVIDNYLGRSTNQTVGDYAASATGRAQAADITASQDALIKELKRNKLISGVENRYVTVMNGIAVNTKYGNVDAIKELAGVDEVILADTYNRPAAASDSTSSIVNSVDVYDTGIFNSGSVSYTGKGTAVAVLDSGFDCSHPVFNSHELEESDLWLKRDHVASKLQDTNAIKTTAGLKLTDVWYSNKIPFTYDYADKDNDVFPYDSEHGTHVAGIIGGKDSVITGVAVDTQLVLMKVFPDLDDGAKTDDILAALEDAVLLGVDCINMSLGSSCGFTREEDGNRINEVYDKINDSGVSILTAASNSYSSAFGGEQGNTNKVTNPDSATVGSPSTYRTSLSVASISGVKSKFLVANDELVMFFHESSSISGKENDFVGELDKNPDTTLGDSGTRVFDYVTVPGYGERSNYQSIDVRGKIALVKRGVNTFEDKALRAKNAGAVACIIYNNVEGDISMSMGKTDHIPTISISKELGTKLATHDVGTLTVSRENQAGPFMSDFSSWGPSPNLELKPEITAHGGKIKSSVPNNDYDELSGTSMATPNLCGIVVLIRQFLKEKFPDYTQQQIVVLANQMLMSTATIVLNEEGNPYSPRKQGAGLASLYNVVNTKAYLSVDGIDRTKLELKDDPERAGIYDMSFNVVNISDTPVSYKLSLVGMSETVSTSDPEYVAEKGHVLGGGFSATVSDGSYKNGVVTVEGGKTAKINVTYKLTDGDRKYIDSLFPYGMFVEGFVKLVATEEKGIDLNVPFLAFYGDWTQAPMFDKTYYEVETEAHDGSIDDEDKLKADYFATTPYGSYFYNYIIPLGTYIYDIDPDYDYIPATEEHIAIGSDLATIDGISSVYGGLLRNAKTMKYTITDKLTGTVVKEYIDYNANKAYSLGGTPIPYYEYLNWKMRSMQLVNNREYEFKMTAMLDYGDGGVGTNMRNTFDFDFTYDIEAPVLKEVKYEKIYDKTLKKDRYYLDMTIYDNHYAQSITPLLFTSSNSYTVLTEYPIPIYSEKGKDNVVRIEITDFLKDIYNDALITSALGFSIDDYALNSNIYMCQLPGTRGDFKFTRSGEYDGSELTILTIDEGEVVDLTKYLATSDPTVDADKDYLKHLDWSSSNTKIAAVERGQVLGLTAGRATITVTERMELRKATLLINVRKKESAEQPDAQSADSKNGGSAVKKPKAADKNVPDVSDSSVAIEELRFDYFDTTFAYSRAAQSSDIGKTGSKVMLSGVGARVSMYPGERIKLSYDLQPWYVRDKYTLRFASSNDEVASVNPETGAVTALRKGSASITLRVYDKDADFSDPDNQPQPVSNIMARVALTVNSEFIIENRTLVAYKGYGDENGRVVIPDDEGILYIGAFAFCLYDTDNTVEVPEDDMDANKIPSTNTSIKSIVVPEGVEDIQKYAFYNCPGLESVELPSSVKYVREFAFDGDYRLKTINLDKVIVIGRNAFRGCKALTGINVKNTYAIGANAFDGCTSIKTADLTSLRNAGAEIFKGCTGMTSVILTENTKLSDGMFVRSGLKSVDIYERIEIPKFCFAQCDSLERVALKNDLVTIGYGAFCQNDKLTQVVMKGVEEISEQAFYDCGALTAFTLPDSDVKLGSFVFLECNALKTVRFGANTQVLSAMGAVFQSTDLLNFEVSSDNKYYSVSSDGKLLLNKAGDTVIFAATGSFKSVLTGAPIYASYVFPKEITRIASGAFGGVTLKSVTFEGENVTIDEYAFARCDVLETVTFKDSVKSIGAHAFRFTEKLRTVNGLDKVKYVGDYAFADSGLTTATLGANAEFGEGAFFHSKLVTVTIGASSIFGNGAFQNCLVLKTVNMPVNGGVHFGASCFANDAELMTIDLSKHDAIIESEAFYGCKALRGYNGAVRLDNVTEIGRYAFGDCESIQAVVMPNVKKIGEGAFARYDKNGAAPAIEAVVLPESLTEAGDGIFLGCEHLSDVTLPSHWTAVPDYMFAYCIRLGSINLPAGVTRIGVYSFAGCEGLTQINLGNVTEIADYAFTSAKSLETVDLKSAVSVGIGAFASTSLDGDITANNLVTVGDYAFQSAYIDSFEAEKLAEIGIAAFQYNRYLTEFVLSDDLSRLGLLAFNGCSRLESFAFASGEQKSANGFAMISDGALYIKLDNKEWTLASVPAAKRFKDNTLVVAEGTRAIDFYAGNDNATVEKIVLPDSLMSIGNYAFFGYAALTSVEFRSYTAPTLESAYIKDAALDENAPGYGIIHNQFNIFGSELCYFTFVDMVGKKEPISMILPANAGVKGYDSIVYEVYFGKVGDASRSTYIARDEFFVDFVEYARLLSEIESVTIADEKLVDKAISAYKGIKQDATKYGYTEEQWNEMVDMVYAAKAKIEAMRGGVTPPAPQPETVAPAAWWIVLIVVMLAVVAPSCVIITLSVLKGRKDNNGDAEGEQK